uniref:DNA-binding protein n=1 Tax=Prevotella sp. GTC17259 TaxID=3236795 RepID=A0AB33J515_9BACT
MENHEMNPLLYELRTLREEFKQVADFIKELKHDYSILEEKIELSTGDVLHLLGISKASLARWRESNSVPYRYVSSNHVVYPFKGLYIAIKTGRATFKGFRRLEALQRLNAYKDGILKGYMGDNPQTLFEEL